MQITSIEKIFNELKNAYIQEYGKETLFDYTSSNCVVYWISKLKDVSNKYDFYEEVFSNLAAKEWKYYILFHYNTLWGGQDFWDRYDGLYRECRSIVLDIRTGKVVLYPYDKFFNYEELEETSKKNIENLISKARIVELSEKIDGSFIQARYLKEDNELVTSSSKNLYRNSYHAELGRKMLLKDIHIFNMVSNNANYTFIFEMISIDNPIIVRYNPDQEGLYLIGARNMDTYKVLSYEQLERLAAKYHVKTAKKLDKTLDQFLTERDDVSANDGEGVVVNIDDVRVKVKYNNYLNMHRVLNKIISPKFIKRAMLEGNIDDFLSIVPTSYKSEVLETITNISKWVKIQKRNSEFWYSNIKDKPNRKEFMLTVDKIVPNEYKAAVRNLYLNRDFNWLNYNISYQEIVQKIKEEEKPV